MMNHHMPAGNGPPHMPMHPHPHSRRQQEFAHFHQPPPQSSMMPYGGYPHPPYYAHQPPQYQQARWQHHMPYPQPIFMPHPPPQPQPHPHPHPHQHQPPPPQSYQPRSPMVVSSNIYSQPMPSLTRQTSNTVTSSSTQATHSPRPIPPHVLQQHQQQHQHQPPQQHQQSPQQLYTPAAPPSPALTPKQEQVSPPPATSTPQAAAPRPQEPAPARRQSITVNPLSLAPEYKTPFYPTLPWYSNEGGAATFPRRDTTRRKLRQALQKSVDVVALPAREVSEENIMASAADEPTSEISTIAPPSDLETPATSQAPSESECTRISTPTTPSQAVKASPKATPTPQQQQQQQQPRRDARSAIAVPNIPGIARPKASPPTAERPQTPATTTDDGKASATTSQPKEEKEDGSTADANSIVTPPAKPAPKSWADLVRRNVPATVPSGDSKMPPAGGGISLPKSASLADALREYNVGHDSQISFLEPRGLVNTGNMCYMNSILQILVFCVPFYNFLDQVRQRTVHSVKSDTPLVDAMILFMREFKVLTTADTANGLRAVLNQQQLEQYGEPVTPEYVYDAIRKLDRFNSMRRGHQQDAEEFLGFLLEGLHDESVGVMQKESDDKVQEQGAATADTLTSPNPTDGWLEVGPKQKASITRHAGNQDIPSPITKIFGGNLRSELRVQGLKDSVTLEPYKPLQLDIGAQNVNNIIDALKGLTRTESLTGDFGGRTNTAKKQVFIDTLPPVLILHLKRFQYENNLTGTQKIWKKVGYPLELEIPKEVFTPAKRGGLAVKGGLPMYRLTAVVYHHGKSAAGGHYTVDVLRQDSREWVRMDDTSIRRIRPEDVAEGGAEEDPKILARALEQHKADQDLQKQRNIFQGLDGRDGNGEAEDEESKPWSEVNGSSFASAASQAAHHHKKLGSIATNGSATPTSTGKRTPTALQRKEAVRDNKVAYILFYERMKS